MNSIPGGSLVSPRLSSRGAGWSLVLEEAIQVTASLSLSRQGRTEAPCLSGEMTSIAVSPGPRPPRDANLRAETRMCWETGPAGPAWSPRVPRRRGGPARRPCPCLAAILQRPAVSIPASAGRGRQDEWRSVDARNKNCFPNFHCFSFLEFGGSLEIQGA